MTSGYMWNRIRTPPFLMPGKNGEVNYIATGFSTQLGVESQIIASVCKYKKQEIILFASTNINICII